MSGAEMKIPTPEELEAMMGRGELKLLGAGSRRECYAIPGTQLCLKYYRDESTAPNASVAREIRKYRHDEKRNTCAQEYRYWLELKSKLPAYIFAADPEAARRVASAGRRKYHELFNAARILRYIAETVFDDPAASRYEWASEVYR